MTEQPLWAGSKFQVIDSIQSIIQGFKVSQQPKLICMNWYITKIVFQVIFNGKEHLPQFDEQLRVVAASSKDEAFNKAQQLGMSEEGSVVNIHNNQLIEWKFINVSTLYQLKDLLDGAEVCSTTLEPESADNYIEMVNAKAFHIKNSNTLEILQLA